MNRVLIALFLAMLSVTFGAVAAEQQSHRSIQEAVYGHLIEELTASGGEINVKVGKLDQRLRLAQCSTPLTASLPPSSRRVGGVTVKVSCEGNTPWTIYIQAEVEQFGQVMVASRNLRRGEIISRDDMEQRRVSLGLIRGGYISKLENILGWQVKRNISSGKIISPNSIMRQLLVKRGDVVVIIAKNGGFEVKMGGVAKSSGAKGDTVQVINQSSKKVVEGIVIGLGLVQVQM
ncbi:MAG: flagellar basal body P-ring formation chaperone FlgA [Gammaproteobacteria bacterium]|nr:flagellar basal body P-ring formation chaperone FlgA [Gammaproteobacteria bacterium]